MWSLGGSERERVAVEVTSKPTNDGGYNWVKAHVSVFVGGFSGNIEANFLTSDFVRFRDGLRILHNDLKGNAVFETLEGQLNLKLSVDKLGHVTVDGEAVDIAGVGNKLIFQMNFDQSYLSQTLQELDAVIAGFLERTD